VYSMSRKIVRRGDPLSVTWLECPRLPGAPTRKTLGDVLHGNLGTVRAERGSVPVGDYVAEAYGNSMGLVAIAVLVASALGTVLGILAALANQRARSLGLLAVTVLGISTPSFFAGLLLQVSELYRLRTFGRRLVSIAGSGWDLEHMLLALLALGARPLAYLMRATYVSMEHVLAQDCLRTALASALGLTFLVVNLVLDLLYRVVDPQARERRRAGSRASSGDCSARVPT